jgi:hypothetical protein
MDRIRQQITRWVDGRPPAELAVRAAGAVVIAVVPGALAVWVAYRLIRTARAAWTA